VSEYDHEPTRGLPEVLPEGEQIIWQGAPDWRKMAANALHLRLALVYFAVIGVLALVRGSPETALAMLVSAAVVSAISISFAYGVGRTTVYTLTDKRIVLRIGVALNKCINIPLSEIETANLKPLSDGNGNIVMTLKGMPRMGYVMLWPHARSLRLVRPQPMLRAIPDAQRVAQQLFEATSALQPIARLEEDAAATPEMEGLPA